MENTITETVKKEFPLSVDEWLRMFEQLKTKPDARRIVHEAGHAFMGLKFNIEPVFASEDYRGKEKGILSLMSEMDKEDRERLRLGEDTENVFDFLREPYILLGGAVAEKQWFGKISRSAVIDIKLANKSLKGAEWGQDSDDIMEHMQNIICEFGSILGQFHFMFIVDELCREYIKTGKTYKAVIPGITDTKGKVLTKDN